MKNRHGEVFRDGRFYGQVIAANDQFALIRFASVTGFVTLAANCDGVHSLVMTIGLPPHVLTAETAKHLHRSILRFFDCRQSDCLLVTTRPLRMSHAESYLLPAGDILSPRPKSKDHRGVGPEELFSFPRRFDLASMMAISSGYALLFAAMRLFDASPYLMFALGGLIAMVGVSQAILFAGDEPRKASLIVGGVYCAIATGIATAQTTNHVGAVIGNSITALFWGPPLGYLAGALVGGVFLIAEYGRRAIKKLRGGQTENSGQPTPTRSDDSGHPSTRDSQGVDKEI